MKAIIISQPRAIGLRCPTLLTAHFGVSVINSVRFSVAYAALTKADADSRKYESFIFSFPGSACLVKTYNEG